jgi:hypothetical protein
VTARGGRARCGNGCALAVNDGSPARRQARTCTESLSGEEIMKVRRALVGATITAVVVGLAPGLTGQAQAAAPARDDSFDETVYLVKGRTQAACGSRWAPAIRAMTRWGWQGRFVRVGFYGSDTTATGCDVNLVPGGGTENTHLKNLGRALAWNIYNEHSSKGRSVDLVGHSMGGLIIRAAVAGYAKRDPSWPPVLYVEDAVTLGTPHLGTELAYGCSTNQCEDMRPTSDFVEWLRTSPNPQAEQGTDWTLIASQYDSIAPPWTSSPESMGAHHLVRYDAWAREWDGGHSALRYTTRGRYEMSYRNHGDRWRFIPNGAAPIRATQHALYWANRW